MIILTHGKLKLSITVIDLFRYPALLENLEFWFTTRKFRLWGIGEPVPDAANQVEAQTTSSLRDIAMSLVMARKSVLSASIDQTLDTDIVNYIERETVGKHFL